MSTQAAHKKTAFLFAVLFLSAVCYRDIASSTPKMDFLTFYVAGQNYRAIDIYDVEELNSSPGTEQHVYPYIYSPFLAAALSCLPPDSLIAAQRSNSLMTVLLSGGILWLLLRKSKTRKEVYRTLFFFLFAGAVLIRYIVMIGQIDIVILFLITWSVHSYRHSLAKAMLIFACAVLIKPIILPFLLFFMLPGKKSEALAALIKPPVYLIIFLCLIFLISLPLTGTDQWWNYLHYIGQYSYGQEVEGLGPVWRPENNSLISFAGKLSSNNMAVSKIASFAYAAAFASVLFGLYRKSGNDRMLMFLPCILLAVLISPYAWRQHLIYIIPAAAISAEAALNSGKSRMRYTAGSFLIFAFIINFLHTRNTILMHAGISYHFLSCINTACMLILMWVSILTYKEIAKTGQ